MPGPTDELRTDPLLQEAAEHHGHLVLPPVVLLERLGEGGMGAVYRGHHLNLHIDVAVKCLKTGLAARDASFVDRFEREARIAATVSQENLVRVYDTLRGAGLLYTVMEFVDGDTLSQRVARRGPMSPRDALTAFAGALRGLRALHARGVLHRDVKPANIMIARDGAVKVADLGIAKNRERVDSLVTTPGALVGTPKYMSPEQFEDPDKVDERTDLYALALTLGYTLVGRNLIGGEGLTQVMHQVVNVGVPDLATLAKNLPGDVCELVRDCTRRDVKDRPTTRQALDAADALLRALGGPADLASPAPLAGGDEPALTMIDPPTPGGVSRSIDRHTVQQIRDALTLSQSAADAFPSESAAPLTAPVPRFTEPAASATRASKDDSIAPPAAEPTRRRRWPLAVAGLFVLLALGGGGAALLVARPDLLGMAGEREQPPAPAKEAVALVDINDDSAGPADAHPTATTEPAVEPEPEPQASPPVLTLAFEPVSVAESVDGGQASLHLSLSRPAEAAVTVVVSTRPGDDPARPDARPHLDYAPITSRFVRIPPGETAARIDLNVLDNDADAPDRWVLATIDSPANATVATDGDRAWLRIVDDDEPAPVVDAGTVTADATRAADNGDWPMMVRQLGELLAFVDDGSLPLGDYADTADALLLRLREAMPDPEARRAAIPNLPAALRSIASSGTSSVAALLWVEATVRYDASGATPIGVRDPRADDAFRDARDFAMQAVRGQNAQPAAYRYLADILTFHPAYRDVERAAEAHRAGIAAGDAETAARAGRFQLQLATDESGRLDALDLLRRSALEFEPPSAFGAYWYAAVLEQNEALALAHAAEAWPDAPADAPFDGAARDAFVRELCIASARGGFEPAQQLCESRGFAWKQ